MTTAIIQARMGSTRLPGKVLMEIDGVPLLRYMVDRVKKSARLDKVVMATTTEAKDNVIAEFCAKNGIECFRGAEDDVLDRYYQCAKKYKADIIVRLTSDCPLIDPAVIDEATEFFVRGDYDYVSDTCPPETRKFPDGNDVEIMSMKALERAHRECNDPHDREHVTFYFWKYDNGFKTGQLGSDKDYSEYRITVDYPEDIEVVGFIMGELKRRKSFGHLDEIIQILEANPRVKARNSQYYFGIGWKK